MGGKRRVQPLFAAAACVALSILAILLWGKLKLVTGVPRSAYAEPRPRAAAPAASARAPSAERPGGADSIGR